MTTSTAAHLRRRIAGVMIRDRRDLLRRLERGGDAADFLQRLEAAEVKAERRRLSVPALRYPPELPVTDRRDDLLQAIRDNQVVIVAGETGSGKSTQLPKLCLEAGRGVAGMIGHTQPRRIAARAVAERVAEELGTEIGALVGYTVRFNDRAGENTLVRVMTDGILLAELQRDRSLTRYDTLIVDEAHERSLNIDFILGYLRQLLPRRPDLKVIVTSATIDTARFSEHFATTPKARSAGGSDVRTAAPVVEASGRTYPVEVRYRPPDSEEDQPDAIVEAVEELWTEGEGDILVFLSGEREIRDAEDALRQRDFPNTELLPLYARLSAGEQHRVFEAHPGRRVVLATNVAETSLTVPGIRYVVDPGNARISRYSFRTKVQRLPIEAVSQASANQRAGRCGRVAPGICIRLYGEDDYVSRPEYTEPEILRTNLASVILQMAALGLGDVEAFPFVDPPDRRNVKAGVELLEELGALTRDGALTPVGRKLAQLPIDPRLGRMVLEADKSGCVHEVMVIAAALSIQDPRERPQDKQKQASESHARFADPGSDFVSLLNLWNYVVEQRRGISGNQFRKLCRTEFLNYLRVREWQDIYGQLRDALGAKGKHGTGERNAIHIALLSGLLSHVGTRDGASFDYQGARGARFALSPGSVLFKKAPAWVMAGELVETTRLWAHVAAKIEPEWAELLGAHIVKRSYGEPAWDESRGFVTAEERVTLYGLPIVQSRRMDYARVDPAKAREVFIVHALVRGEWRTQNATLRKNRVLLDEVRAMEDRARRRDLVVEEQVLYDFYDQRVPPDVVSGHTFEKWAKRQPAKLLALSRDMVLRAGVDEDAYPNEWRQGDLKLPLRYEFEPGSETDGVTVAVPLAKLNQINAVGFDWPVPGMREELVTALIKSLPKDLRTRFVPAPDHARRFLATASPDQGPLKDTLARFLGVEASAFQQERLPRHLAPTFQVTDERGKALATGKDLDAIKEHLKPRMREAVAKAASGLERTGITSWDFGTLPRVVEEGGARACPAVVDEKDAVAIRMFESTAEQLKAHRAGVRRLLVLTAAPRLRDVERLLPPEARLSGVPLAELLDAAVDACVDDLPWTAHAFAALQERVRPRLMDDVVSTATTAAKVVALARQLGGKQLPPDASAQLERLVRPGFVTAHGARRLPDILRYLKAIDVRLDKRRADPGKDASIVKRIAFVEDEYAHANSGRRDDRIPWMIEELRVSLFAQQLGTSMKVSEERVLREIDALG